MPLFQNSSKTVSQAQTEVARSGGAASFSNELTRALEALQKAMRWWNREGPWEFTRTVNTDISVVAGTATYDLPHDIFAIYDVRLSGGSPGKLTYVGRRYWDTVQSDQSSSSTPYGYDLFRQGTQGMIELIPKPGASDTLVIKYYRRLTVPCDSDGALTVTGSGASADIASSALFAGLTVGSPATGTNIPAGTVVKSITSPSLLTLSATPTGSVTSMTVGGLDQFLDIPDDYEDAIINKAISLYLAGREDRAERAAVYGQLAQNVLDRANAVNFLNPDEEVVFVAPSDVATAPFNPNSIVQSMAEYGY